MSQKFDSRTVYNIVTELLGELNASNNNLDTYADVTNMLIDTILLQVDLSESFHTKEKELGVKAEKILIDIIESLTECLDKEESR